MHEITLCQRALELIEQQAAKHGAKRVTGVWLKIGAFSCVETSSLAFCFDLGVEFYSNRCFMTKDHAQGVFIRFIDFRGELLLRASAIDGVTPAGKNGADEATYVYLNGTRLLAELPYQTVREIISEAEKARQVNGDEPYIEIICMDSEAEIQKAD